MSLLLRGEGVVGHVETDSVLIEGGFITAIGRSSELAAERVIECQGFLDSPKHDHHFHPFGYTGAVSGLNLKSAGDFDGIQSRVEEALRELPPGTALIGGRLDDESLAERRLPNRFELDQISHDVPTLLYRYCGHFASANSAALALAGLDGHPDGILREDEVGLVSTPLEGLRPPLDPELVIRALRGLARLGLGRLTAIISVGDPLWCETPDELAGLLAAAPSLPLDLDVLVIADNPDDLTSAATALSHGPSNVRFAGWKSFADGALGGRSAALYDDYSDDPANRGILRFDHEHSMMMARRCRDLGGQVAVHAIGDRANDIVLDFFAELIAQGFDPAQLRIEHASMVGPKSRRVMGEFGVTASVQPSFITSEVHWLENRVGPRLPDTYCLGKMAESGIPLVGGSDSPVEDPNPWPAMAAARIGGLNPAHSHDLYGPVLKVGGRADLIVLDRSPLTEDVAETAVIRVFRQGEEITPPPALPFV